MGLNRVLNSAPWRVGDASSRLLLDVAAGRPIELHRPLNDHEMELAAHHGLLGLMADQDNSELSGPAVALYARLAARHGVMRTHLHRILTTLHAASIQATVLKGLHLAEWAYCNPAHRTTTDIDLLVPADQVNRVLELLEEDDAVQTIPAKTPKADKRNVLLADPSGVRFTLDLHWDLFSYTQLRGCADGATDWAWKNAAFIEDHPLGPMWELPEEARIAFLCTHALLDHRFRLILFRDLTEVARTEPDWEALLRFVSRWRLRSTTYLALLIAVGLADAAIDRSVLERLRHSRITISYLERALPRTDMVRFDGHLPHPLNLAVVLVHDDQATRFRLALEAPAAFPGWSRRVEPERAHTRAMPAGTRPPSVLIVISTDRRRGAEVFGERLAAGLAERGWDKELVSLMWDGTEPRVNAMPLEKNSSNRRFDVGLAGALRRHIRYTRPDVVLANGGATLRHTTVAMLFMRKAPKLAYTSIGEPAYWIRGWVHKRQQSLLLGRVDLVLAISKMTSFQLTDLFRVDPSKVEVAYTGVPEEFLADRTQKTDSSLHLLFLGNLSAEKDPLQALELVRQLARDTEVQLRFVGGGPLLAALEREAARIGVADRVTFVGSVSDVCEHISWADLLVLTSRTEGFPGVVLEAAAASVPSVAFGVGGTAEAVDDGATGVIIAPRDVVEMASQIRNLSADRERIHAMGKAAFQRVESEFLLHHSVHRYDLLLRRLLPSGSADLLKPVQAGE